MSKEPLIFLFLISFIFSTFSSIAEEIKVEIDHHFISKTVYYHCEKIINNEGGKLKNSGWVEISRKSNSLTFSNNKKKTKLLINLQKNSNNNIRGLKFTFYDEKEQPSLLVLLNIQCKVKISRLIIRSNDNLIVAIANLSEDLLNIEKIEKINPKVPDFSPPNGIEIALIDTGVNYTLKTISPHLSRLNKNTLSGYDFYDNDDLPFDVDFTRSPFFPMHHGTAVASVIVKEAPNASIVIYRFPRNNMCKFEDLVKHVSERKIKIANLAMGSKNLKDWECFEKSVRLNKNILFFVSAGNDGKNIDFEKIYPASFNLDNILVVTSSDIFGKLAKGSNYGEKSVDFMIPGEQIPVIDHRGVRTKASGSSYAVPRLTAMAARYLSLNPHASISEIKKVLISRTISTSDKFVKYGWIPDPTDNYLLD